MFRVKKTQPLFLFLKERTSLSGKEIKRSLEQGACLLNGKIERFGSVKVEARDQVIFSPLESKKKEAPSILYQDLFLTFFNKPSGMVSAPQDGHFLVHRLDKGTSGVLVMARTQEVKRFLELSFKKRNVKKVYLALIQGIPKKKIGTIQDAIGKTGTFHGQTVYGIVSNGKKAITHYKVIKKRNPISLIELHPETGRTHQLRVHLSALGHPILGDWQYGRGVIFPKQAHRLCLHAYRLQLPHPQTGEMLEVTAPLPSLFKHEDFNC